MALNIRRLAGVIVVILGFARAPGLLAEEMAPAQSQAVFEGPATVATAANAVPLNQAMVTLVGQWRNLLDQPTDSARIGTFLKTHPLKLDLVQGTFRTLKELESWIAARQQTLESSQHKVIGIKTRMLDQQILLLEFEYEVAEKTVGGPRELSRIRAVWRVDYQNPDRPLILEMSESYLPPEFNSGARIQC